MDIGTAPVPELISSMGMALGSAFVLSRKQSSKNFKIDAPVPFHISAADT